MVVLESEPPEQALAIAVALTLAAVAAVFAAASAALAAISDARLVAMREHLEGPSKLAVGRYLDKEAAVEARWLVLRVLGVAGSALLLYETLDAVGALRPFLSVALAAMAFAIPSELARAMVARSPERAAVVLLRALRPVEWLVVPVADPVAYLAQALARTKQQGRETNTGVTEAEVEVLVNEGELRGALGHEQSEMIRNVLDFGDITAEEVMVPRTHVASFDAGTTIDSVLDVISETHHSRYPVYHDNVDNIVGILHVKDLMQALAKETTPRQSAIETLVRKPVVFVPESQLASSVLKDMRARRHHMAAVIDEFGGFAGIVTLEDILEEIVGDIQDEHDKDEPPIVDLGDGRLLVDASIPIADINRYLGLELPDDGDFVSLGGLVVERMGRVPEVGATLDALGVELTVREADERHVVKVELKSPRPTPETIPPRSSSKMSAA